MGVASFDDLIKNGKAKFDGERPEAVRDA